MNLTRVPTIFAVSALISACATTEPTTPIVDQLKQMEVQAQLRDQNLVEQLSEVCALNLASVESRLTEELERDVSAKVKQAERELKQARELASTAKQSCDTANENERILIGEVEDVTFVDEDMTFEARVDSGAETSSIGVYGLREFERDGKDWVRFKLVNLKTAPAYEYRIRDDVKIKTRVEGLSDERFEIRMDVRIGGKLYRRQVFNLANRRHFEYQALLGRSFLRDTAIVDVTRKHVMRRKKK